MSDKAERHALAVRKYAEAHRELLARKQRAYYNTHREAVLQYAKDYNASHQEARHDYWSTYAQTHAEQLRESWGKYREQHRAILAVKWRVYSEKNKTRIAEVQRKNRPGRRDAIREYTSRWYTEHKTSVATRMREYQRSERGRAIKQAIDRQRRARKRGALGVEYTTVAMIQARCEMWGHRCYICGGPMQAIDHVKPLVKGGAHLPCNLRPICKSCNSKKGSKWG
jgi:5-methylcytosine-specific restriction endonuclease McrA